MSLRRAAVAIALFASLVALAGCGSNSDTPTSVNTPTDSSAPAAPIVTGVVYDGSLDTDVLNWSPSASPDVVGYEVYMYSPDPTRDNSYVQLGRTIGTTGLALPPANGGTQYFRVKALSSSGTASTPSATLEVRRSSNGVGVGGGGNRPPGQGQHDTAE